MISLQRIRTQVPLVVFVLLLICLVVVLGVACACATDHPAQTIERALSAISAAPPVVELWSLVTVAFIAISLVYARPQLQPERASPAQLQRFLF